jgi:hypothetical protein
MKSDTLYFSAYQRYPKGPRSLGDGPRLLGKAGTKPVVAADLFWKDAKHWVIFNPKDHQDFKLAHPGCPDCLKLLEWVTAKRKVAI